MTLAEFQQHVVSTKNCPSNADLAIAELEDILKQDRPNREHDELVEQVRTILAGNGDCLQYCSNALCGEAGEFANQVKKAMRDDLGRISTARRHKLVSELGDVLWYIAACCDELGATLDDVAKDNIDKLNKRGKGL